VCVIKAWISLSTEGKSHSEVRMKDLSRQQQNTKRGLRSLAGLRNRILFSATSLKYQVCPPEVPGHRRSWRGGAVMCNKTEKCF